MKVFLVFLALLVLVEQGEAAGFWLRGPLRRTISLPFRIALHRRLPMMRYRRHLRSGCCNCGASMPGNQNGNSGAGETTDIGPHGPGNDLSNAGRPIAEGTQDSMSPESIPNNLERTMPSQGPAGMPSSGVGGNPSFTYSVKGYDMPNGSYGMPSCQGTLTRKENGVCAIVTAAHCLSEAQDLENPQHPHPYSPQNGIMGPDGRRTKMISMQTKDFGTIRGRAVLNPEYVRNDRILGAYRTPDGGIQIQGGRTSNDIAMVFFEGAACEKSQAKVVPMASSCDGPLSVASRWRHTTFMARAFQSFWDKISVSIFGGGIKQGDSGGALFCHNKNGETSTVGVLSTGNPNRPYEDLMAEANYSSNSALQWAMGLEQQMFQRPSGRTVASNP